MKEAIEHNIEVNKVRHYLKKGFSIKSIKQTVKLSEIEITQIANKLKQEALNLTNKQTVGNEDVWDSSR